MEIQEIITSGISQDIFQNSLRTPETGPMLNEVETHNPDSSYQQVEENNLWNDTPQQHELEFLDKFLEGDITLEFEDGINSGAEKQFIQIEDNSQKENVVLHSQELEITFVIAPDDTHAIERYFILQQHCWTNTKKKRIFHPGSTRLSLSNTSTTSTFPTQSTDSDILFMGIHHPDESTKYSDVTNEDVEEFPPFQPRDTSTPNLDRTFDMDVYFRQERRTYELFMRDAKNFRKRRTKFIDGKNTKKSKLIKIKEKYLEKLKNMKEAIEHLDKSVVVA
ncbi:hypothetical protein JTB14_027218 [Gonioctena quinquepunctata]|nr:hypothetical protein JTB14_027218 [Gonioctena quinquepunctata]